jgi:hypothetical protein
LKKGDDLFVKQKKWLYAQALEFYLKANNFILSGMLKIFLFLRK